METIKNFIKTIILSVVVVLIIIGIAHAWTEPSVSPPNPDASVSKPLTESKTGQIKAGGLWIASDPNALPTGNGLIVGNGKVGVGTVNPNYLLDIFANNVISPGIAKFEDGGVSGGDPNTYLWVKNRANSNLWGFKAENTGDWGLHQAGVGDRIHVSGSTGKVGIGTTNPGQTLDVNGGIGIKNNNDTNLVLNRIGAMSRTWILGIINGSNLIVRDQTATRDVATFDTNGNVWIGTGGMAITPSGLRFPDGSVQTKAAGSIGGGPSQWVGFGPGGYAQWYCPAGYYMSGLGLSSGPSGASPSGIYCTKF